MSQTDERQLPRGGRGLRGARRGQAPGDGQGAVDLAAAGGARRPRARRLARRAGVRVRARRPHARVRGRGAGHEVDHRAPGARTSRGSTASPTSPTTRSRRSSTTSAASARCRWSSTPTSRPAPRSGTARPSARASLLEGWRRACADAGCAWGGGESPSLPGLLAEREIELAGAAVGARARRARADPRRASSAPGDEIVLVASSGLHANGASLARLVAGRLPDGYATALPSGTTLGEALLEPSVMYVAAGRGAARAADCR